MASLYLRGGVYWTKVRINGRLSRKSTDTHDRQKAEVCLRAREVEAQQARALKRERQRLGIPEEAPDRQERLALSKYLEEYKKHYLLIGGRDLAESRGRSWVKESASLKAFVKFAEGRGVTKVDRATPSLVEDFKRHRATNPGRGGRRLSDHTVNHTLRVLKAFFYHAKRMGFVKENPVCGIKPVKTAAYEIKYLNESAVGEILKRALAHPLHPLLATAVYAGLREAELAAIEWPDVHIAEGFIAVRNTETFRTKSRKPRMVPLAPALKEILEPLHAARLVDARKAGKDRVEGLCFPNEAGTRYKGVTLTHRIGRLRDAINEARTEDAEEDGKEAPKALEWTLQTLRRTFGTILRLRGVPLDKISKWLGHNSVKVTEGWYSELPFDGGDDAIAALDFRAAPAESGHKCGHTRQNGHTKKARNPA